MKLGILAFLLGVFAAGEATLLKPLETGTAVPSPSATSLAKRISTTHASFYACTQPGWKGTCDLFELLLGECLGLDNLWNDKISSFGPDEGYECVAYIDAHCKTTDARARVTVQYPGLDSLMMGDKIISSVKCKLADPLDGSVSTTRQVAHAPIHIPPSTVTPKSHDDASTTFSVSYVTCTAATKVTVGVLPITVA